jgi:hypothetical protein
MFQSLDNDDDINDNPYSTLDLNCNYFSENEFLYKFSKKSNLFILNLNIQSLQSKYTSLKETLDFFRDKQFLFDIICLQEVWNVDYPELFPLEGYLPLIVNCRKGARGGGVGIYIRSNLQYKIRDDLNVFYDRVLESLVIEVEDENENKFLVVVLYRSSGTHPTLTQSQQFTDFFQLFDNMLSNINASNIPCYIMTDSNINLLNCHTDHRVQEYLNLCLSHGFINTINHPTRITSNDSASLIDHIFTNSSNSQLTSGILTSDISDHLCTFIQLEFHKSRQNTPNTKSYRSFSKHNINLFKTHMSSFSWNNIRGMTDVQIAFDSFWFVFSDFFEEIFPIKNVKINRKKQKIEKWMTKGLLVSRNTKLRLRKKSLEHPTLTYKSDYKTYRNLYNKLVRKAKENYYKEVFLIHKNNPKKTWGILNEIRKKSQKSASIEKIVVDKVSIKDKKEISEKFNSHFTTIAGKIVENIPPSSTNFMSYMGEPSSDSFDLPSIVGDTIIKVVNNFENKCSLDSDGLSINFIKQIIYTIVDPLTHIFNLSFQQGRLPHQLKTCRVVPIYKSGKHTSLDNYRPIGLISVISKIMEKLVCNSLTNYLEYNELIYQHQYGFRKKHSTIHPIIHFLNRIAKSANNHEFTIAIFCDLQKCFDVLDRSILLNKLEHYGVKNTALKWFSDYFEGRLQYVEIDSNHSTLLLSTLGVIQGSILGPIFSNLYLNDLYRILKKMLLFSFADDSKLTYSDKSLETLISVANSEFRLVAQWMRSNRLMLHPDKTKFMIFCPRQKPIDLEVCKVYLNNNDIGTMTEDPTLISEIIFLNTADEPVIRFLGLFLDPHLTFKYHVSKIVSKVSKGLYILRTVKHLLPESALRTLYFTLINSHLIYALPAYGCADTSVLKPLIQIQKKAVRIISGSKWNAHCEPLFKRQGVLRFVDMIRYSQLEFMYNWEHKRLPISFIDTWRRKNDIMSPENYSLRNALDLHTDTSRLTFSQKLPIYSFPVIWNTLEVELRQMWPPSLFKKQLKSHFLDKLQVTVHCENPFCPDCFSSS